MGRSFVKHTVEGEDRYLVWSSVIDAPITYADTLASLRAYWKRDYGRVGLLDLDRQIAHRGEKWCRTVDEVVSCNKAGSGETQLTAEQIVQHYFVERKGDPPKGEPSPMAAPPPETHVLQPRADANEAVLGRQVKKPDRRAVERRAIKRRTGDKLNAKLKR
jgi:hypothetical protein